MKWTEATHSLPIGTEGLIEEFLRGSSGRSKKIFNRVKQGRGGVAMASSKGGRILDWVDDDEEDEREGGIKLLRGESEKRGGGSSGSCIL